MKNINKDIIKNYFEQQIKKDVSDVDEPSHAIAITSGTLQIKRPQEALGIIEGIQSEIVQETAEEHEQHRAEKRVHTGIQGLDDVMEGGFRADSVNLIGGGAGSGKSILCMQFLVEGITRHNENGVYISFEEPIEKILKDFDRFKWGLRKLIESNKLVIVYYSPEQIQKVLQTGGGIIRDVIESVNAKRLVLDSLTAFTMLFETELEKRKAILKLMEATDKWGVTTLMTSEHETDPDMHESTVVEFEVDGVILLYNIRKGDIRERSLEVFKMRGTRHATKIFPMKIDAKGITIFPEETVF